MLVASAGFRRAVFFFALLFVDHDSFGKCSRVYEELALIEEKHSLLQRLRKGLLLRFKARSGCIYREPLSQEYINMVENLFPNHQPILGKTLALRSPEVKDTMYMTVESITRQEEIVRQTIKEVKTLSNGDGNLFKQREVAAVIVFYKDGSVDRVAATSNKFDEVDEILNLALRKKSILNYDEKRAIKTVVHIHTHPYTEKLGAGAPTIILPSPEDLVAYSHLAQSLKENFPGDIEIKGIVAPLHPSWEDAVSMVNLRTQSN